MRRDNDNNEMKRTTEHTLQEWTEIQTVWELMGKQMNSLEQALFSLDEDSVMQRIGTSTALSGFFVFVFCLLFFAF